MLQTDSCFNWRNTYSGETNIFDDDADYHGDGDDEDYHGDGDDDCEAF